jgi:arylsulfatase A-like enzyme
MDDILNVLIVEDERPIRMARTEEWKLMVEDEGTNELYDLDADPHELANLYRTPGTYEITQNLERLGKHATNTYKR